MAKLALLNADNFVRNIIVGELNEHPGSIDVTGTRVGVGWFWNGADFVQPQTGGAGNNAVYQLGEFVRLCTDDEWGVLERLAQGAGTVNQAYRAGRLLRLWLLGGVDFNDQLTIDAVMWLVQNTVEWTFPPSSRVPHPYRRVATPSGQQLAIARKSDSANIGTTCAQRKDQLSPRSHVPDMHQTRNLIRRGQ